MALIHTASCLVELAKTELNSEASISLTEQVLFLLSSSPSSPPSLLLLPSPSQSLEKY
jgi:hypothetical protein